MGWVLSNRVKHFWLTMWGKFNSFLFSIQIENRWIVFEQENCRSFWIKLLKNYRLFLGETKSKHNYSSLEIFINLESWIWILNLNLKNEATKYQMIQLINAKPKHECLTLIIIINGFRKIFFSTRDKISQLKNNFQFQKLQWTFDAFDYCRQI